MSVVVYLFALPLALSTYGALGRLLDDADVPRVLIAIALRLLLAAVLVWLAADPGPVAWAFVTAFVAHLVGFYALRLLAGVRRKRTPAPEGAGRSETGAGV